MAVECCRARVEEGHRLAEQGRHRQALGSFDAALTAAPGFLPAHLGKLLSLVALSDLPGSLIAARQVVRFLAARNDHERIPDIRGTIEDAFPGAGIFVSPHEPVFLSP